MSNDNRPSIAVYLVHFLEPVHGARHYVGRTTPARLHARMIEHTTARGARLTTEACRLGIGWRLANFWYTRDQGFEARQIARTEARQLCPVCRGLAHGIGYEPTKKEVRRGAPLLARLQLTKATGPNQVATQSHEKRQPPEVTALFPFREQQ